MYGFFFSLFFLNILLKVREKGSNVLDNPAQQSTIGKEPGARNQKKSADTKESTE